MKTISLNSQILRAAMAVVVAVMAVVLFFTLSLSPKAVTAKQPGQPNMEAALVDLKAAREHLKNAEHNKGGHRAKAVELVNQAIDEVKAGIDFAN